ncbi:MAG: transposase [Deltaproteobacteria bacterium]|nr:transposase [Deltaproteobacteria bacterium]
MPATFLIFFAVDAARRIHQYDRAGLEALLQYALRPPICESHLSRLADGRLRLRLKRPLKTGLDEVVLTPFELIRRIAGIVPQPGTHEIPYYGSLGSHSWLRPPACPGTRKAHWVPQVCHGERGAVVAHREPTPLPTLMCPDTTGARPQGVGPPQEQASGLVRACSPGQRCPGEARGAAADGKGAGLLPLERHAPGSTSRSRRAVPVTTGSASSSGEAFAGKDGAPRLRAFTRISLMEPVGDYQEMPGVGRFTVERQNDWRDEWREVALRPHGERAYRRVTCTWARSKSSRAMSVPLMCTTSSGKT